MNEVKEKIIIGFSGGVDSTTAVDILRNKGYQPVAVFFKMFSEQKIEEIQARADKIEVELIVKDISKIFEDCIIKGFLSEYQNNRTPNPCVKCNYEIKFKFLLKIADEMGIDKIATGHYAQIKKNKQGQFELHQGLDEKKDQSYFLYRLTQKELARIIFPLGDRIKKDIKEKALEKKWFEKIEESQDVCFLGKEQKIQSFLKNNLNQAKIKTGEIRDEEGILLGEHQGLIYYTQGQRKGLDLSGGPYYVIHKKSKENVLVVSKNKNHPNLNNQGIYLEQVNWIVEEPDFDKEYQFKSRYRSQFNSGKLTKKSGEWVVVLDQPQWAVAKGQSMVIYNKGQVIGGGIIKKVK